MSFQVLPVRAQEKVASIPQETEEVVKQKRNIFEEFHYRVFLKDTRDFFDFVLLGIFITGLLIVLVFKNTHYVVVQKSLEAKTFLETGNVYSVDEIETPTELVNAEEENTVLDGLYSWDELKILQEELKDKLTVIAIIADRELRYDRLSKREIRPFTREQAVARDIAEIENSAKGGPIAMADYYIDNNHDLESYKERLLSIIESI